MQKPNGAIEPFDISDDRLALRDLRAVVAIARAGSVSAAARQLRYAQATLSAQLAAAEAAVGERLFRRTGRGMTPTPAGHAVLRHATAIFEAIAALRSDVRLHRTTNIVIAATEPVASRRLLPALHAFERASPDARTTLKVAHSVEVHEMVARGEVEIGLAAAPRIASAGLRFEALYDQQLALLVPARHRLAAHSRVGLLRLAGERVLLSEDTCAYRRVIEAALREADVEVALRARFGSIGTLPHAVAAGLGVAIVPAEIVEPPPPRTLVVRLQPRIDVTIGLCTARDLAPGARSLAAFLRRALPAAR